MRVKDLSLPRFMAVPLCLFLVSLTAWAQTPSAQSRIVETINENARITLSGNTHPLAQARFDQGPAAPDLPMARMLLLLKRNPAQESALQALLDAQQDPNSASFHQWLTPDTFGQQFGPSDQDIQTISSWLQSHGFQVSGISRGRTTIEFSGTAAQVLQAFHTEIHKYSVNGKDRVANASDPQIPTALATVVDGIVSLHNFPKKPAYHLAGVFSRFRATGQVRAVQAVQSGYTTPVGCGPTNCYFVGPYDFAAIYNLSPLWSATPTAIDGAGQGIAIVGESNINLQDVADFRNLFGLPSNVPNVVIDGPDPGLVPESETEAVLDVEWSGAVAKGATINLVIAQPTESTAGADLAALHAVDNNISPVVSESFLQCELFLGAAGNNFQDAVREQAAAQGITFLTASGDQGSAGCDFATDPPPQPAIYGLMVNGLASSPNGVAVGGTDFLNFGQSFNESAPSSYWSVTNDPHQASALGYIPESTWNSTCTNNIFVVFEYGRTPEASCNNAQAANWVETVAGGGGKSNCTAPTGTGASNCTGGYPKPSWQSAPGVPADGARDIPDVSLFASSGFVGSAYIVCEADQPPGHGSCSLGTPDYNFLGIGGTSVSTPAFAGIMALVNQFTQSGGQGNANHVLYKLASSALQVQSSCNSLLVPASTCIFNDISSGTIATACAPNSPTCTRSNAGDIYGVLSGYPAGAGYDLATGLGSVNIYNLVHDWSGPGISTSTTLSLNSGNAVNITHGQAVAFAIGVSPSGATGDVSLTGSPTSGKSVAMGYFALPAGDNLTGTTSSLAGGNSYQVKAHYAGDATYAPSDSAPVIVTVAPEPSTTLITIPVFNPSTGVETGNTPASVVYGSSFIARMDVGNAKAAVTFPMNPVCATLTCPTGSVTLSDSLSGASFGAFPLNSEGYTEDLSIQLTGGAHQLTASYPGDNSYQSSTGGYSIAVTPVATSIGQSFTLITPVVGTPFGASVIGYSQAIRGVAPTGTVTFYDGKTQIGNSGPISGFPAGYDPQFFASATLTVASGGARTISAQYSGDANYAASTTSTTLDALYAATANISVSPSTVNYGASVTTTGVVDTANPATNATLKPTGTVLVGASLSGNNISQVTTTTNADPSGNWQIQVSATAIPSGSEEFNLYYSGDSNYAPVTGYSNLVTVNIPDFSLGPAAGITIAPVAGQAGSAQVTVTPLSQIPSPVTFSVNPPIPVSGYTLTVTPQTINLNGSPATATISLTPTVTAPTNSIQSQVRLESLIGTGRGVYWPLSAATGLAALFLVAGPRRRRRYRIPLGLTTICIVLFVLGCAGGSSSSGGGGGGGGGGGPQPTTITLSTSSAKIGLNTPLPITATVTSASGKAITGNVTFYNFGTPFGSGYSPFPNGQYTFQGNIGELGIYQVTASYSGDSNNLPSTTSSPLIQAVTGSVSVMITGNTGVESHSVPAAIGLQ